MAERRVSRLSVWANGFVLGACAAMFLCSLMSYIHAPSAQDIEDLRASQLKMDAVLSRLNELNSR